jgi:spore germination cell wall hydrolase CwlJ-like protein
MKYRSRTAHRRADRALLGGAAIVVASAISAFGVNLHTDQFGRNAVPAAEPALSAPSPAELAGARLAAESGCLSEVMYYEARGEGVDGEKAVAEVVLQRTRNVNYPDTVCGVVHEGVQQGRLDCQFSFACDGSADKPKDAAAWLQARLLAEKIMSGAVRLSGETGHAIAFHNVGITPVWADTMLRTTQIGNHVFYRFAPRDLSGPEGESAQAGEPAPRSVEIEPNVQTASAVGNGA